MSTFALNNLSKITKDKKRVGRGIGCGSGKTSGSGHKGQKARSGTSMKIRRADFARAFPKIGFNSNRPKLVAIDLGRVLEALTESNIQDIITIDSIRQLLNLKKNKHFKITMGKNPIENMKCDKFAFSGISMSESVKKFISSSGGKVE